ncbi:MAG: nitroreductase family protein [Candidatus Tectomicrobia bacterium]|uniref:Nitroreductase family protein n=1 Tax=Tectimicrobiota bacterium TaxID=2528274 RepID=A0A933GLE8_UNCTE|nr:nitroreductase family protein [Candidatus Tectomicrobia bacterium]
MDIQEAIKLRHSVRVYTDRPVEEEKLLAIMEAAILAPNGGNSQPWDFILIDEPAKRNEMADFINEVHNLYFRKARRDKSDKVKEGDIIYETLYQVPLFIVACLNKKYYRMDDDYLEIQHFWDIQSVCAAFENIVLMARALGLGTCWMGAGSLQEEKLRKILGIPEGVKVVAITPLGYPKNFSQQPPRMPLESVVHKNRWEKKDYKLAKISLSDVTKR